MVITSDTAEVRDPDPRQRVPEDRTGGPIGSLRPSRSGGRRRFRYTLPGAWVAVIFACLSFTPSLVPRPGAFQGVVCGITGGDRIRPRCSRRQGVAGVRGPPGAAAAAPLVAGVPVVGPSCCWSRYLLGQRWQGQIRDLMARRAGGVRSRSCCCRSWRSLVFVGLVAAGRGIRRFFRWVARRLEPLDGAAGRAGAGLGVGRGVDRRPGQRGAGGRDSSR